MQRLTITLLTGMRREARALAGFLPLGIVAVLLTGLAMNSGGALALFQSQESPISTPTFTPTVAAPTATPTSTPVGPTPVPAPTEATPTTVPTIPPPEMTPSPTAVPPTATPLPATATPTRPPRPTATPTPRPSLEGLGPQTLLRIAVIAFAGAAILLLLFGLVWKWKPRTEKKTQQAKSTTGSEQETDATD